MKIDVYSDGSATVSTKPGGYGWVLVIDDKKESEGSGYMEFASNNDAEMDGAIHGLVAAYKYIELNKIENPEVTLISDSQIILNWASGTFRFKQVNKINKYNNLRTLVQRMNVKTKWVKGHSGDVHNERCDKLANMARNRNEEIKKKTCKSIPTNIVLSLIRKLETQYPGSKDFIEKELGSYLSN